MDNNLRHSHLHLLLARRNRVVVCAVASLLVAGAGVSPVSTTINGCVVKAKTDCENAKLKGANLDEATLKKANLNDANMAGVTCSNRKGKVTISGNLQ